MLYIVLPKEIEDMMPIAETKSAIEEMVRNYDLTGKYLDFLKEDTFYSKYFTKSSKFVEFLDKFIQREYEKNNPNPRPWDKPETKIQTLKSEIKRTVLEYLTKKAKLVSEDREHLRIKAGNIINYNECIYHYPYNGNIEFYKDGGWGIGTEKGVVLLKNHLITQPSKIYPLFGDKNSPLRIIQDRDTKKYGVLSLTSYHEIIHCHYDKIVTDSFYEGEGYDAIERHFLKALKDDKWGCFDENCALLIKCMYHDIRYVNGYYEGIRDGDYLTYDKYPDAYDNNYYGSIYVGKKDLYNSEGLLLIGGYDEFEFKNDYFLFYWGTSYKRYYVKETDIDGGYIKLSKLKLNYENAHCLIVDKNFISIAKHNGRFFRVTKGMVFNNMADLKNFIPLSILYPYRVYLNLSERFVYLTQEGGGSYINTSWSEENSSYDGDWKDELIEDDSIIIIHYTKEMDEEWRTSVNEVGITEFGQLYYRIGTKYGFYSTKGIDRRMFDAIIENTQKEIFVAHIDRNININDTYEKLLESKIFYYKRTDDSMYKRLDSINDVYNNGKLACTIPISFPYTDYTTITNNIYGPFQIPPLNPEENRIFEEFLAFLRAKDK
jgi:hypothetical protein